MNKNIIDWASGTDVGIAREHNEDAVGVDKEIKLAVLADGMGGYNAGEVASAIAVREITREVHNRLTQETAATDNDNLGYTRESVIIKEAIFNANQTILNTAEAQPQCKGMGTTVVALMFYDNRLTVAHLGDSRLYRMRGGRLEQLTVDHSLVQELEDLGHYTHEEAINSPQKNYITRAMGVDGNPDIEIRESPVMPEDLYLICSDGLSDLVRDEDIWTCLTENQGKLEKTVNQLIQRANDAGGMDNISVILAKVRRPFPKNRVLNMYSAAMLWFHELIESERMRQLIKDMRW